MTSQSLGGQSGTRRATWCFHGCKGNAICIISNSAWSAARVLQDLYNSFILVLLQLCRALNTIGINLISLFTLCPAQHVSERFLSLWLSLARPIDCCDISSGSRRQQIQVHVPDTRANWRIILRCWYCYHWITAFCFCWKSREISECGPEEVNHWWRNFCDVICVKLRNQALF